MVFQQLEKSVKIVSLISFQAKSSYHMQNHTVVISADFVAVVFFRTEIACDTKLFRMGDHHSRCIVAHSLRNGDLRMQPLLLPAVKMNKAAHSVKQSPGDGQPQPQSARQTVGA